MDKILTAQCGLWGPGGGGGSNTDCPTTKMFDKLNMKATGRIKAARHARPLY